MQPADIFRCRQCGDCCKGFGGTYVTPEEIRTIAEYLRTDSQTFEKKYCQKSGRRPVLAQAENGYCIFWDNLCTIHPVKPRMCRQWPFIPSVLTDVGNWRIMAGSCPGMRADASETDILACVREVLSRDRK